MKTIHLPLPPSWEHAAYIAEAQTATGPVWRIIQIAEATTGPNQLDDTVTTLDLELFSISDWSSAEAARQAAQDAALTIRAREDLFTHITYLRDRARKIHAALHQVADHEAPPSRLLWPRPITVDAPEFSESHT